MNNDGKVDDYDASVTQIITMILRTIAMTSTTALKMMMMIMIIIMMMM